MKTSTSAETVNIRTGLFLKRPLSDYRVIVACVRGSVSVTEILGEILDSVRSEGCTPILLLGPTSPSDLTPQDSKVGWITFAAGEEESSFTTITPQNLTDINLFIEKSLRENLGANPVVVGDFLDNILSSSSSLETLYSFYSQLASRMKQHRRTGVFLIKEDLHDQKKVEMIRRFADVILEYRLREEEMEIIWEMRAFNFVDKIYTGWISRARSYETGIALEGNLLEGNTLPVTGITSQN